MLGGVERNHKARAERKALHKEVIKKLSLNISKPVRDQVLASVPVVWVGKLSEPYPPLNTYVHEEVAIGLQWRHHLEEGPQADGRHKRKPLHKLDMSKLQYNVQADKNVILSTALDISC